MHGGVIKMNKARLFWGNSSEDITQQGRIPREYHDYMTKNKRYKGNAQSDCQRLFLSLSLSLSAPGNWGGAVDGQTQQPFVHIGQCRC